MNAQQAIFRSALTTAYADLFATSPDYAYSASRSTPAELADRMLQAFIRGSGSHQGEGVKRACKTCGIPHTLTAILNFVGHVKAPVSPRIARKVTIIGLSNIESMMTGVSRIMRAHDLVTVEYTDGKRESASISALVWSGIAESPIKIVGFIQSQRKEIAR